MHEIVIFIVGLISGFLGATVGGGGMVSVPALLFLGFSPQTSVAINKVGDIGVFIAAAGEYWQTKKIDWKMATPLMIITVIGSVIGTQIMVRLETSLLEIFIGMIILIFLPFFFFSKNLGLKRSHASNTKKIIGLIIYTLLTIQGAVVGAGGATVALLVIMYFFGYEIIRGYATNTPAQLLAAIVPSVIYAFYGFVDIIPALVLFFGALFGGFIGALTAIERGNIWVKNLFTLVIIASVIKIFF